MNPSLAQMVRKWLKTYSTKSQWEFQYDWVDEKDADDLNVGFLRMSRYDMSPVPAIKIEKDHATIGQFTSDHWGGREWTKSIHSDIKLIAADPRFFAKLDRTMQFLTRAAKRREENNQKFAQEEIARLKDILR